MSVENGNGRWEFWFKTALSALLAIVAFVGVKIWDKTDELNSKIGQLSGDLRVEVKSRQDLSANVDKLTLSISDLSASIATGPPPTANVSALNKEIKNLSIHVLSLQSQLDDEKAARSREEATDGRP